MGCESSDQKQAFLPGVNQYERKEMIGVGHHGRVYRSLYLANQKDFALKVIDRLPNLISDQALSVLLPEVNKLTHLAHSKIASYRHLEVTNSEILIVMEISKEGTLKKQLQKFNQMTQDKVALIAGQLIDALRYLHDEDILHRDFKTSNVLLFGDEVKISDFGVAHLYDSRLQKTPSKQLKIFREDSMRYMAPEVVKGFGYTKKADIWSFGCVVLEMLTGKIPWFAMDGKIDKIFQQISNSVHSPLPLGVSKSCEDFLTCCLTVIATQRSEAQELRWHPFITSNYKTEELFTQNKVKTKAKFPQQMEANPEQFLPNIHISLKKSEKDESPPRKLYSSKNEKMVRLSTAIAEVEKSNLKFTKGLDESGFDDPQYVFLNNKKVRIKREHTQPADCLQERVSHTRRIETQPEIFDQNDTINIPDDKDSFKKPLRLLKRKIRQSKMMSELSKNVSLGRHHPVRIAEEAIDEELMQQLEIRLRSQTQASHDDAVIDTMVARVERNRYINEQLFFRKQKEEERQKWEKELEKGAQILKKEFKNRYESSK